MRHVKKEVRYWRCAIESILQDKGLVTDNLSPYILAFDRGQNPVFWIDGKYVLKFHSYTHSSEADYKRECEILEILKNANLTIPNLIFPTLVTNGLLYDRKHPFLAGSITFLNSL